MKNLIFILFIIFNNCSNNSKVRDNDKINAIVSSDSVLYTNRKYKMVLFTENNAVKRFKLYNRKNNSELSGKSELIKINGEIPEGTNRIDYNNPSDIRGYAADSTYQYLSKNIKLAFAIEKTTKKRLDLSIYGSTLKNFNDGDHTLLNQAFD